MCAVSRYFIVPLSSKRTEQVSSHSVCRRDIFLVLRLQYDRMFHSLFELKLSGHVIETQKNTFAITGDCEI